MQNVFSKIESYTGAKIKIGIEIEFYAQKKYSINKLKKKLGQFDISEETGTNQYEIRLGPSTDYVHLIKQATELQRIIKKDNDLILDPSPYYDEPSSGIHIHVNLINQDGYNLFEKHQGQEAKLLLHSIGGMLKTMKENLKHFSPSEKSLQRYKGGMHNPSKICWGINNRTAAIRVPAEKDGDRRIEHRVPSSDCNINKAVNAILSGMLYGIISEINPGEKIYGNAFLDQYPYENIID
ncbi:MAG: hypothetical protein RLN62_06715 [Rickettsiales bacterium]